MSKLIKALEQEIKCYKALCDGYSRLCTRMLRNMKFNRWMNLALTVVWFLIGLSWGIMLGAR